LQLCFAAAFLHAFLQLRLAAAFLQLQCVFANAMRFAAFSLSFLLILHLDAFLMAVANLCKRKNASQTSRVNGPLGVRARRIGAERVNPLREAQEGSDIHTRI
jgi:hypothetical protein